MSTRRCSGANARATCKRMEGSAPPRMAPSTPQSSAARPTGATPSRCSRQAHPTAASNEDQDQDAIYRYIMILGFRKMKDLSSSPDAAARPKFGAFAVEAIPSDPSRRKLLRRRLTRAQAKPRNDPAIKRELYAIKLEFAKEALNDVESIDDCTAWFDHMYTL